MKRLTAWGILVAFSWLQLYQICDASEDTIEIVSARLETLSHSRPSLQTPAAPDDDADASIPFVAGEVLTHDTVQMTPNIVVSESISPTCLFAEVSAMTVSPQGLSPPGQRLLAGVSPIATYTLERSPANILAPPLV